MEQITYIEDDKIRFSCATLIDFQIIIRTSSQQREESVSTNKEKRIVVVRKKQ